MSSLNGLALVQKEVRYFRYQRMAANEQVVHGVFTRHDGVSEAPYQSLNTSYDVGDRPEHVTANLHKIREAVGANHLIFVRQSHGDNILVICKDHFEVDGELSVADAMITNIPNIALLVKLADCQGVVVFDPKKRVVANIHSGWRGTVRNLIGRVVLRMQEDFGCNPTNLLAAIGPSLGPCCAEFDGYKEIFPASFERFMVRENYFDLWSLTVSQLQESGLRAEKIELAGVCTRCMTDLFYSYRGEGKTGRFGVVVMLK